MMISSCRLFHLRHNFHFFPTHLDDILRLITFRLVSNQFPAAKPRDSVQIILCTTSPTNFTSQMEIPTINPTKKPVKIYPPPRLPLEKLPPPTPRKINLKFTLFQSHLWSTNTRAITPFRTAITGPLTSLRLSSV